MSGTILVVGETVDGQLTKLSTEVATLARTLAEANGLAVAGLVAAPKGSSAGEDLARFTGGDVGVVSAEGPAALDGAVAERKAEYVFLGATPDGRDAAGRLSAALGIGVLTNAVAVAWEDGGPVVEMSVFGGKLVTRSAFTGKSGIVTVRANAVAAEPAAKPGRVTESTATASDAKVRVVDRIEEAAAAASIEDAAIIVAGGRGVGGAEGFKLVDELAEALGGAVGATRAAVDAGWINYSQQIGQTGKIVKPRLYLALGISGAIQHKVGMQTAETIIAVNRDPDAPIAEYADLVVIGDLFEVIPALIAELKARAG
ncbi:MAG TPA: electron transfer flavoprotein subunit alpha/FixB family protein [Candidatus Limnocylindrales bacterium]